MINNSRLITAMSEAVKIQGFSSPKQEDIDKEPFLKLHRLFEKSFPALHSKAEKDIINGCSLLYRWRGKTDKDPMLLMGHLDVVPADAKAWRVPPFSGTVENGIIHGRGTIDCKHVIISVLEAAESLCETGFIPERDIYFFFGHDEESGGKNGAGKCVELLKERNIRLGFVLDEGGQVEVNALPDFEGAVALPAIAEKGILSVRFIFFGEGGHASAPSEKTALGAMAAFILKVEQNQSKERLAPVVKSYFEAAAPYLQGEDRELYSNPDKNFDRLVNKLKSNPSLYALLHTTATATMVCGSNAHNVLPSEASCVINCRILQGESVEGTLNHLKSLIPADTNYNIEIIKADEPSIVSDITLPEYGILKELIKEEFGDIPVIPNLLKAATDCRKFDDICPAIFRFMPLTLTQEQGHTMHNINEYITEKQLCGMAAFYEKLMRRI